MCLTVANHSVSVTNPSQTNRYVHMQLSSHFWIKFTTSSVSTGNSLIVSLSSSDIGIPLNLLSWPAKTIMLSVSLCITPCDSSWPSKRWKIGQSYYSRRNRKIGQLGKQIRCRRPRLVRQDSAALSQITRVRSSQ